MPLSPTQRTLRAKLAAHSLHASVDSCVHTQPGRKAFLERFEREVDPDGVLNPAERARRADQAKKAYFVGLALKSSKAHAKKSQAVRATLDGTRVDAPAIRLCH